MQRRRLGKLEVSAVGLGCVGMSSFYGAADEAEAEATLQLALDLGVDLLDTSDSYGAGGNERLIGRALNGRRERAVIATKFGAIRGSDGQPAVNGRPDYVPQACDASLMRLGVEHIDLYYLHRLDRKVPIEDTVGAVGRLVELGKVRFIGLSEVGAQTLRRAHATFPLAAVQSEFSLWTRKPEASVLPVCAELGIGFVAFSPVGRGFLTGTIESIETLDAGDKRREVPRFQDNNLVENRKLLDGLRTAAAQEHCTLAQLALAWILARAEFTVPIPGTKRRRWLVENADAAALKPAKATLDRLDAIFQPAVIKGERNTPSQLRTLES